MVTFGYFAKGLGSKDIAYYVIDANGKVKHEAWFEAPVAGMIHDCALTQNYFLLPIMPYTTDIERLKARGPFWVYEPEQEIIIGVIPRNGKADQVRWLRAPHATLTHTINAFEQDGLIKFDVTLAEGNAFGFVVPDKNGGHAGMLGSAKTSIVRWTIDPKSTSTQLSPPEVLAGVVGEGAHIDERWFLKSHRYVWIPELAAGSLSPPPPMPPGDDPLDRPMPGKNSNAPVMFNAMTFIDLKTNRREQWYAGEGASVQDPVFCPRSVDAPEGEGYIVTIRNRPGLRGSEAVILDAQKVAAGPIAVLQIPMPLRHGIHSSWTAGYRMK
jgi:carotenoid cleavage dioxygenase